ncbi:hypothetical protein R3P38DRAFT_544757 [Favolaschia claudopus]|uniref:Ricin B lectin domain-containing protein n=1 Tax=Favolaschia claudopus TaxID=2862362 RepID=A0AAW0CHM8_9AGAR
MHYPSLALGLILQCSSAVNGWSSPRSDAEQTTPCALNPGVYEIFNGQTSTMLRSSGGNGPIFVTYAEKEAGPFGQWRIESVGPETFTMMNVGLQMPAAVDFQGEIVASDHKNGRPQLLSISSAGGGDLCYIHFAEDKSSSWTADARPLVSTVSLETGRGDGNQQWRFQRIGPLDGGLHTDPDAPGSSQIHFRVSGDASQLVMT